MKSVDGSASMGGKSLGSTVKVLIGVKRERLIAKSEVSISGDGKSICKLKSSERSENHHSEYWNPGYVPFCCIGDNNGFVNSLHPFQELICWHCRSARNYNILITRHNFGIETWRAGNFWIDHCLFFDNSDDFPTLCNKAFLAMARSLPPGVTVVSATDLKGVE